MSGRIWTSKAKRKLFELVQTITVNDKVVGRYNPSWNNQRPPNFSKVEWNEACQLLLDKLIRSNVFGKHKPSGMRAVRTMLYFCTCSWNDDGARVIRSQMRLMAYYAGFMRMTDIVRLEDEAERLRPTYSSVDTKIDEQQLKGK